MRHAAGLLAALLRCGLWQLLCRRPAAARASEISELAGRGRCEPGERDRPHRHLRGKYVFVDEDTTPEHPRSGFLFPRLDARLHHGDEVHFESPAKNWLALSEEPTYTLLGKTFDLVEVATERHCGLGGPRDKICCNETGSRRATRRFKIVTAGDHFAIQTGPGRYCSDTITGVFCRAKEIGGWETFQFVPAESPEGRLVRLRGLRRGLFCVDAGQGMICDQTEERFAPIFRLVLSETTWPVPVLRKDRSEAATFIVRRDDLNSPMIALLCKRVGRYLAAELGQPHLSCSSLDPWFMDSERVPFRHVPGKAKWDVSSVTLKSTATDQFVSTGKGFNVQGLALLRGDEECKWKVLLTGGCEILRPLIRGVNLGNWFLLERWMARYLFEDASGEVVGEQCEAQDEFGLLSVLGAGEARRRMEAHWSTWITEKDIRWMSEHGINAVRVPIGYWMVFPTPPFVPGQLKYLEMLYHWCEKYAISILLDFHGLKGSQTGTPTSGNCGGCGNETCGPTWLNFLKEQKLNLEVIRRLVIQFSNSPSYLGFAVANEVSSNVDKMELMSFYQRAYDVIREHSTDGLVILCGTFAPSLYPWDNFRQTWVDMHVYFGWGFGKPTTDPKINFARATGAVGSKRWPVVVGEWSLAANGHPTMSWPAGKREEFFNTFARMQLQAWEQSTSGWFYWSYKTRFENSTWNYRDMCEVGWLPGCDTEFAPAEWWDAPLCAYAYLDGPCQPGGAGLGPEGALGGLLLACCVGGLAAFLLASVTLKRSAGKVESRGLGGVVESLPWGSLPELPSLHGRG